MVLPIADHGTVEMLPIFAPVVVVIVALVLVRMRERGRPDAGDEMAGARGDRADEA